MSILALNTTTEQSSVSLYHQSKTLDFSCDDKYQHAETVLGFVQLALREASITLADLKLMALTCGPGSFVGTRLGCAVVQALAFAQNTPVTSISTLRAIAQATYNKWGIDEVVVVMDARMGQVYRGEYALDKNNIMQEKTRDCLIRPEDCPLETQTHVGSGVKFMQKSVKSVDISLHATDIIPIARDDLQKNNMLCAENIHPVYLQDKNQWKRQ